MDALPNLIKDIVSHKYSVKESRDLLEYLVNQKMMEWQVYNVDPSSENYMTEAKMKDAIEYIIKKMIIEMTPVSREILSVGFPMKTEEQLIESIKNCAKLVVLKYSIDQNEPKEAEQIANNIPKSQN